MRMDLTSSSARAADAQAPIDRPRRLRRTSALRDMVAENTLRVSDLVEPLFVVPGSAVRNEIASMPGVHQQSVDRVVEDAKAIEALGIPAVLLFGIPERKDDAASSLADPKGPVQLAIRALKREVPSLLVIADLCACEY